MRRPDNRIPGAVANASDPRPTSSTLMCSRTKLSAT